MSYAATVKPFLKRGALVAAANWHVIVLQFVAETGFKLLLFVPLMSAAFLVALLVGGSAVELASLGAREMVGLVSESLGRHPVAMALFLIGTAVVVVGGSALTYLSKSGTVAVLVQAERQAPPIERPPLRLAAFRQAEAFSVDRFSDGASRLFTRYLVLGLAFMVVYGVLGAAYLAAVYGAFRLVSEGRVFIEWTLLAALISAAFVLLLTIVNLLYLLAQITIAIHDCPVAGGLAHVRDFLRRDFTGVTVLFVSLLVIVGLATVASILATASLGFIAFIPVIGLAVLPLQLVAWLARGIVFQYLGHIAVCAYVRLYTGDRTLSGPGPHAFAFTARAE